MFKISSKEKNDKARLEIFNDRLQHSKCWCISKSSDAHEHCSRPELRSLIPSLQIAPLARFLFYIKTTVLTKLLTNLWRNTTFVYLFYLHGRQCQLIRGIKTRRHTGLDARDGSGFGPEHERFWAHAASSALYRKGVNLFENSNNSAITTFESQFNNSC